MVVLVSEGECLLALQAEFYLLDGFEMLPRFSALCKVLIFPVEGVCMFLFKR